VTGVQTCALPICRRIVRARLDGLVKQGLLVEEDASKVRTFRVSDRVVRKWSEVLGLS
jgi:DNA-binding transcriptional regulator PaaX